MFILKQKKIKGESHFIAAILVKQHKYDRHDNDDTDHDDGVKEGRQQPLTHIVWILFEGSVDAAKQSVVIQFGDERCSDLLQL